MYLRALETIYYGEVRRRPAEFDNDGNLMRKADIFMLRERRGKDKDNKPIILTVKMQYLTIGPHKVEIVDVKQADINRVLAAKKEVINVEATERHQDELDEMNVALQIADAQQTGPNIDEMIAKQADAQAEAEMKAMLKSPEELAAEAELSPHDTGKSGKAFSDAVAEQDAAVNTTQGAPTTQEGGTGNREVLE